MVSLVLLGIFLFFVAFSAFVGLIRGMNKSVIRLITLAVAMILTFFVSAITTNLVAANLLIEGQTLGELVLGMLSEEEAVVAFLESAPLLKEAILVAPAFAMAIVIFPVVFFLLSFISWIVFRCIQKPLRKRMFKETFPKTKEEKKEMKKNRKPFAVRMGKRFAGMGIGAVTGALIFGMILAPVLGLISVLPNNDSLYEVIDTMVDQDILDADTAQMIKNEIAVRDQALLKSYRLLGFGLTGKLYLSAVSRIEYEGQKTNIPAEFDSVFSVAQVAIEGGLLKAVLDTENPKAIFTVLSNQEFVDELIGEMFNSRLFCAAIPEVMALAMESVALSLSVPADKNAVYNNMMNDIAESVNDANIDYAGIKAYEDAQVAADYVAADAEGEGEVALMTKEEYEAEIQKLVDLTLKISKIINTAVASSNEAIANTLAGQIMEDIKSEIMANGGEETFVLDSESVKNTISEISVDDASVKGVLDQLNDPEKFETNVMTADVITQAIRESVESAVADKSKAGETASALASVVCNLASAVDGMIDENGEIVTDENGNVDVGSLDFSKIADAVTTLQNSNLKDVGSSMLDLIGAGDLGEGSEIITEVLGAIKESYDNGEDIGGTINSAGAIIIIGSSMGSNDGSKENVANSFKDLVQNLNETTLKLLSSVLSEETLLSMGVEKEFAAIAFDVVDALLRELMELKNSANYEEEVNTVLEIYDIISAGTIEGEQVENLVRQMLKSRVIMNTLERVSTDILSADLLISLDVPAEYADEIYTAISASINEMIKIRNANAEAYNAEIDTLVSVYGILAKGDMTEEQIVELVGKMMKSDVVMNILDRVSGEILTADLLISMDVPEKYAEDICTALTACIDEMLAIRNADAEKYNAEIDAMASMLITLKNKELTDKELAKELVDLAKDSDVLYNVLMKISDSIVIEVDEGDREDIKKGIEEYYGETDKTDKDRAIFNAVAKIFAIEVTLQ